MSSDNFLGKICPTMLCAAKYSLLFPLLSCLALSQAGIPKNDIGPASATTQAADSIALEPITKQNPVYPKEAAERGLQGQVMLKLSITETGDVEQVEVLSGDPVLAQAAAEAAKNWKYKPFIKNGHAVRVNAKIPFNFAPAKASGTQPDSTALEPVKTQQAIFPLQAINQQIQGRVWIKLLISETGDVEHVDVISGEPMLAESAVNAAKKWKFKPFIKNGNPIKVQASVPLDFTFEEKIMKNGVAADGTASNDRGKSTAGVYPSTPIKPEPVAPDNSVPGVARPDRVRVSQGVTSGLLIRQVAPVYPSEARSNHIQGAVLFQAIIGKDGNICDLQVLSGPKELVRAATAAVQQWQYRPYLLMGEPVEVQTTIQINFQMR